MVLFVSATPHAPRPSTQPSIHQSPATNPHTQMAFYMQGEMGATVFFYPQAWSATAAELRARLGPAAIVGIGLNNNKLWYV